MSRDPWTLALDTTATGPVGVAVKSLPTGTGWGWGAIDWRHAWPNAGGYDFAAHRLDGNSVVAIGLNWLGDNVHKGRLVVGLEQDDGSYAEVNGHPLTSWRPPPPGGSKRRRGLLRRPNPFDSWEDTLAATSDSLTIKGEAFWIKVRDRITGEVVELFWAPNHQIKVIEETDDARMRSSGPIRAFRFDWGRGHRDYEPGDVIFIRDRIDPHCRYRGVSRLVQQIRNVASIDFAERATAAVLRNLHSGGFLAPTQAQGMIVEGSPDEAEMDRLGRRIEAQGEGENLGRIPKSSIPVGFVRTGHDVEELGLQWIAQRPSSMILTAMGLNGLVLGIPSEDQSTYANKAEARRDAWENGVIPRQDRIAQAIEHQLLPDFPEPVADSVWWDHRDVAAMREDVNNRAARAVSLASIATVNERRAIIDLPPIEGGDVPPGAAGVVDDDAGADVDNYAGADLFSANGSAR
jgi:Phage portal protein